MKWHKHFSRLSPTHEEAALGMRPENRGYRAGRQTSSRKGDYPAIPEAASSSRSVKMRSIKPHSRASSAVM